MPTTPEQPVYGPVEPRSMEVLQAENDAAAELIGVIQEEKEIVANMPSAEQAQQAGHIALLETDEKEATQMQSDTLAEAQVRSDIDRNRRQARLEEIRSDRAARQKLDETDPIVTDGSGNRMRLSERAEIVGANGAKDISGSRY